jgi:hypothetical protein
MVRHHTLKLRTRDHAILLLLAEQRPPVAIGDIARIFYAFWPPPDNWQSSIHGAMRTLIVKMVWLCPAARLARVSRMGRGSPALYAAANKQALAEFCRTFAFLPDRHLGGLDASALIAAAPPPEPTHDKHDKPDKGRRRAA